MTVATQLFRVLDQAEECSISNETAMFLAMEGTLAEQVHDVDGAEYIKLLFELATAKYRLDKFCVAAGMDKKTVDGLRGAA
ncbi:hypothetical protein AD950_04010 [Gluconobacter oxydans]|nr:hypothetical protein AD950_04010 [Gluconobacter oxydans]